MSGGGPPPGGWVAGGVLYARVPKNACTLLNHWLVDVAGTRAQLEASGLDVHRFVELPVSGIRAARAGDWHGDAPFRFTLLRNPYRRLVSAYTNKLTGPRVATNPFFAPIVAAVQAHAGVPVDPASGVSFAQLVRWLAALHAQGRLMQIDKHLRPQHAFTGEDPGCFHHVGAFERLDETLALLEARTGRPVTRTVFAPGKERRRRSKYQPIVGDAPWDWPGTRFSPRGVPLPEQFYDDTLGALVARCYAQDLALYRRAFGRECSPSGERTAG